MLLKAPFHNSILLSLGKSGMFAFADLVSLFLAPLLFFLGIAAGIHCAILSIQIGNEWKLFLLSFFTLLFTVAFLGNQSDRVIDWIGILYGLTATAISMQWFFVRRNDRIEKD